MSIFDQSNNELNIVINIYQSIKNKHLCNIIFDYLRDKVKFGTELCNKTLDLKFDLDAYIYYINYIVHNKKSFKFSNSNNQVHIDKNNNNIYIINDDD
jgi:hypothetical protein